MAQARRVDPGPQTFGQEFERPSAPLENQREITTKEVILYLTPSQIRALEASKGKDNQEGGAQQLSEEEAQKLEEEIKRQLEQQNIYINDQKDSQRPVPKSPPPIKEPTNEEPLTYFPAYQPLWTSIQSTLRDQKDSTPLGESAIQNPSPKVPESYSFVKIYTDDKVHETPKLQLFHPIPHQQQDSDAYSKLFEVQRDPLYSKEYKLIPYEYIPDYTPGAPQPEEVKELVSKLDKYEIKTPLNVKTFRNPQLTEEPKEQAENTQQTSSDKEESQFKFVPQYNDQKSAAEYQKFVLRLEKENALARAEALLKYSSGVRNKYVYQRRPSTGNKPVSISVSERSQIHRHVWKH